MENDFNPYRSPEAPVVQDYHSLGSHRRRTIRVVAAVSCFGAATILISLVSLAVYTLASFPVPKGAPPRWRLGLELAPFLVAATAFLIAGRSFWRGEKRAWIILALIVAGALASIYFAPSPFPDQPIDPAD